MTASAKSEPGPYWWKVSALTTRPTLPPRYLKRKQRKWLPWRRFDYVIQTIIKIRWTFAVNFSKNYWCFEKVYQTLERVFHQICKYFEVGLKKNTRLRLVFSNHFSVFVFDILLMPTTINDRIGWQLQFFHRLTVTTSPPTAARLVCVTRMGQVHFNATTLVSAIAKTTPWGKNVICASGDSLVCLMQNAKVSSDAVGITVIAVVIVITS